MEYTNIKQYMEADFGGIKAYIYTMGKRIKEAEYEK